MRGSLGINDFLNSYMVYPNVGGASFWGCEGAHSPPDYVHLWVLM